MMTGLVALVVVDLLLIAGVVVTAFVWMRPLSERAPRRQRAWLLARNYALAVFVLWWVGLLRANYPLAAALLVGGVVAALHIALVGTMLWLAAQRPEGTVA